MLREARLSAEAIVAQVAVVLPQILPVVMRLMAIDPDRLEVVMDLPSVGVKIASVVMSAIDPNCMHVPVKVPVVEAAIAAIDNYHSRVVPHISAVLPNVPPWSTHAHVHRARHAGNCLVAPC